MAFVYKYPHPAVTTDCVILTFHEDRLKILLIRRGVEPYKGCWALPGGFLRMDESAEEGALRELREETGVTGCRIKQFHTFSDPRRDPRERVITIAFYALVRWRKATGADDAEFADWIPANELPPLAFDHKEIIGLAMKAIRRDIFFEPVGFELLNDIFSMTELQKVYEAVLGKEFDRRNFAKKMKHLHIIEEVRETAPDPFFRDMCFHSDAPVCGCEESAVLSRVSNIETGAGFSVPAIEQKKSPLPFLNISENRMRNLIHENSIPEISASKPRVSKRRNLFFRLNKKKYDEMKDTDSMEF